MLNLLIAIISDTFDRVQNDLTIADSEAKIELLLEVFNVLFWKRSASRNKYIQICQEYSTEGGVEGWEGKVKAL